MCVYIESAGYRGGVPGKADDPVITSAPLSNKRSSAVAHSSNTHMRAAHTRTHSHVLLLPVALIQVSSLLCYSPDRTALGG